MDSTNKGTDFWGFPEQRLTTKEKIDRYGSIANWCLHVVVRLEQNSLIGNELVNRVETVDNYDMMRGVFRSLKHDLIQNPYSDLVSNDPRFTMNKPKFPVEMVHIDRMSPKVDLLLGEEMKRPFNFTVVNMSPETTNKILNEKKKMYINYLKELVHSMLSPEAQETSQANGTAPQPQIDPNTGQPMPAKPPPEIEKYFKYEYKEIKEITANKLLRYLQEKLRLDYWFNRGFRDVLISGCEIYKIYSDGNEPRIRPVNILRFDCDLSSNSPFIHDAAWCVEYEEITLAEVVDRYGMDMEEDVLDAITHTFMNDMYGRDWGLGPTTNLSDVRIAEALDYKVNYRTSTTQVKLVHAEWKGLRKIKFVTDAHGDERIEDEDYTKKPGEKVEDRWINQVWECTKVGWNSRNFLIKYQTKNNQYVSLVNPSMCRLSYTGTINPYSFIGKIKDLQILYNIVFWRTQLTVALAKNKALVIDRSKIETDNMTLDKWAYYGEMLGFIFVNGADAGDGRFVTDVVDRSLESAGIDGYIKVLDRIDRTIDEASGISPQREAQVSPDANNGTTNVAINQSAAITEPLFYLHNQTKKNVLEMLLHEARMVFKQTHQLQYILDDGQRQFIEMDEEFVDADFGLFVANSARENDIMQYIKSNAIQALNTGVISLADAVKAMVSNSTFEAIKLLEEGQNRKQQESMQQQTQQQQAQQQAEKTKQDLLMQIEKIKSGTMMELEKLKSQTRIQVAEIQSSDRLGAENMKSVIEIEKLKMEKESDQDDNDKMDFQRLEHEKQKHEDEMDMRQGEQDLKHRELDIKEKEGMNPEAPEGI
jgi:hypothetical protein